MTDGIKMVRRKLADGTTATYAYCRLTNRRILGEIGSPEFLQNLDRARTLPALPARRGRSVRTPEGEIIFLPTATAPTRASFVYFVQAASGPIKVGIADNVERRLAQIRNALYEDAVLIAAFIGDRHLEKRLHRLFAPHRLRGEWYNPNPHLFREIAALGEDAKRRPRKMSGKRENGGVQPIVISA